MAEFQVALRQQGEDPEIMLRLAHSYARLDRLNEASNYYSRLLAADSSYADQVVADVVARKSANARSAVDGSAASRRAK